MTLENVKVLAQDTRLKMDIIFGLIALAISVLSIWLGWRSDNATRKRLTDYAKSNERQAYQIDELLNQARSHLEQSKLLIELVRDLSYRR